MIIGSQNLDTQSWKSSRELGIAIDDAATTHVFDREFERRWAEAAQAYELECAVPAP